MGNLDYAHAFPFKLWKVDSWEDKKYWQILQILSKATKEDVDVFWLAHLSYKYAKCHAEEEQNRVEVKNFKECLVKD